MSGLIQYYIQQPIAGNTKPLFFLLIKHTRVECCLSTTKNNTSNVLLYCTTYKILSLF